MRLSRLEIFGFKSFAKKFDLKLTGGITSVVGPNGCGKTNVVDAIRWVLGEQKPTKIRLERMEDVLFKGSANRHPLGMAEVSLTIENNGTILPLGMPEITVTRRLFRSGESDYLINRQPCRLADINDLFMDTGVGSDSYSVFEQSMINSILSEKTEDRRHIFEEAAGVTKYKFRRKAALTKLLSIEDDLARVGDIIFELERRLDSLKRQASKARRYRELKGELKTRTLAIASYEITIMRAHVVEAVKSLAQIQAQIESARGKSAKHSGEIESLSVDIVTVEKELETITGQFNLSMESLSEKEKELTRFDSRILSLNEMVTRAREEAAKHTRTLEQLAVSHGDCAERQKQVELQIETAEKNFRDNEQQVKEFQEHVTEKRTLCSSLEKEVYRIEQEIALKEASYGQLRMKRDELENKEKEISHRNEELGDHLITLNKNLAQCENTKLQSAALHHKLSQQAEQVRKDLEENIKKRDDSDETLRSLREKQTALKAEHDFFAEVIRTYEGYTEGVKQVMTAESLRGRVIAVLGDVISVDDQYVQALESALAEVLNLIIVSSFDDARVGVEFLTDKTQNRAGFFPLGETGTAIQEFSIPKEHGILGPAHEFVNTEERFIPVVKRLLDGIFVVDTLDRAESFHKRFANYTFITLSGEVVGRCGDVHGGRARKGEAKPTLGRTEKLKRLVYNLEEVTREVNSAQEHRNEQIRTIDILHAAVKELEEKLEGVQNEITNATSLEAGALAKKDAVCDALARLNAELTQIKETFASLDSEQDSLKSSLETIKGAYADLKEKYTTSLAELSSMTGEFEQRRIAMQTSEVERATLAEKRLSLHREVEVIEERRESLAQTITQTLGEIEKADEEVLAIGERKKTLLAEIELDSTSHDKLKIHREELEQKHADLRTERSDKERLMQTIRHDLDDLSRKESSLILARDESEMVVKNTIERLRDEFFIESGEIPPSVPQSEEFNLENEKLLLDDIRRKIHSIGDVNLAAEEDYEEEKKRYDFLRGERDDLHEAAETLKKTITKINDIARARFMETFEQIRSNFTTVFQDFFEGGVCKLSLEESVDPLEGIIHIEAKPPGKTVGTLNLLSSGERALTAISLLFAIYLVKPSPFCILDEVDAPLDDANVNRYLRVIKTFAKNTQFIMVTHNKKTMAEADNLYGITMEEPGLSSLVSIHLSEVDAYNNNKKNHTSEEVAVTS